MTIFKKNHFKNENLTFKSSFDCLNFFLHGADELGSPLKVANLITALLSLSFFLSILSTL